MPLVASPTTRSPNSPAVARTPDAWRNELLARYNEAMQKMTGL